MFGNFVNTLRDMLRPTESIQVETKLATVAPNLSGLLAPGHLVQQMAEAKIILPEVSALPPVISQVSPTQEPIKSAGPLPILDDMRENIPPRSPNEIAELLKYETPEQTQRRIANDQRRAARQRGWID
jgi:hypothetical protein